MVCEGSTAQILEAFSAATQNEREIIWSGMAQSVTLKQRVGTHVERTLFIERHSLSLAS